mmetsp:Transcript_19411/g.45531  ORF Transcript_19411/g.45531 Transcript_19411/m.45531 type:complete len:257 (+) Transcript_19411:60-830(+)
MAYQGIAEAEDHHEASSSLLTVGDALPAGQLLREKPSGFMRRRWHLAAAVAGLLVLGLGLCSVGGGRAWRLKAVNARAFEQKFYDEEGGYWQAPGSGISTSEVWGGCGHPHMHICGSYCCCDQGFYWKSPKTLYQQAKRLYGTAGASKVAEAATAGSASNAVKEAAMALGKATLSTMYSKGQMCTPKASVPDEVVKALHKSQPIPDSDLWIACSTFTSNTHTCGSYCCCDGGYHWAPSQDACELGEDAASADQGDY